MTGVAIAVQKSEARGRVLPEARLTGTSHVYGEKAVKTR